MKFIYLMTFSLLACSQPTKPEKPAVTAPETPMVGADVDEHGCKPSAGFSWSSLRETCIQIFESGVRLDPKGPGLDPALSAFIVFKSDKEDQKAELFWPGNKNSLILEKATGNADAATWTLDSLTLKQVKGGYILEGGHKQVLFQGPESK